MLRMANRRSLLIRDMKRKPKIRALKPSSHSCFYYEAEDTIVTVYNKEKKTMRLHEVNAAIDMAKSYLVDRMRGK